MAQTSINDNNTYKIPPPIPPPPLIFTKIDLKRFTPNSDSLLGIAIVRNVEVDADSTDNDITTTKTIIAISGCKWAQNYIDIQIACHLSQVCLYVSPRICQLKSIDSIMQIGPTCGLCALSMLLNGKPNIENLLLLAKQNKFTNKGEMFSVKNMLKLLKLITYQYNDTMCKEDCDTNNISNNETVSESVKSSIKYYIHKGRLYCEKVKDALKNGACLLVPYDADFNHGPCQKRGHKAHWALILGYLIDDEDKFYVFARHGKSKYLALWSLKALSSSNANLIEFEKPKAYLNEEFVIPNDGINGKHGLNKQSIIIENLNYLKDIKIE